MRSFEEYMKNIAGLLENKPPYFLFIFVASTLVFVSIVTGQYFRETWAFFLYAVAGMVWRSGEKDIRNQRVRMVEGSEQRNEEGVEKSKELTHRWVYQIGNVVLLVLLTSYLANGHLVSFVLKIL